MTFYLGFSTDTRFYLAADRRRIQKSPVSVVDDSKPKLYEVNPHTYLTGAGFMYFIDEIIGPQAHCVYGKERLNVSLLERDLEQNFAKVSEGYSQLVTSAGIRDDQHRTNLHVAGICSRGEPFSFMWSSNKGFVGLKTGRQVFFLPRFDEKGNQLVSEKAKVIQEDASNNVEGDVIALKTKSLFEWVAALDDEVSPVGDMVILHKDQSAQHYVLD